MKKISILLVSFLFFSLVPIFSLNFSAEEVLLTPYKGSFFIYLEGNISLQEENFTLQADSLKTLEENVSLWKASGKVRFQNKEETLFIRSREFIYNSLDNSFVASEEVELQEMEEGILLSALEISFKESPFVIIAKGAVSFFLQDIYAQSDFLRYEKDSNTLELIGSASLEKEGNIMSAYRIWVNLSNNQIILEEEVRGSFDLVRSSEKS